jgi:site-specific DNA-methyltransferase (adenine-specific)
VRPYYERDGITIYHGDCREILPILPAYDLVLTDPPYGINYNREDTPQAKHKPSNRRQVGSVAFDDGSFDPSPWITGKAILWGANCYASRLPSSPHWIAWDKVTKNNLELRISEMELAWTNCVRRPRIMRHLWSGAFRVNDVDVLDFLHPTQKPIALMRWCIILVKPAPSLILDPFMGSGTTLRAAKDLGRKAIGVEIEERYCEIAAKRLSQRVLAFGD